MTTRTGSRTYGTRASSPPVSDRRQYRDKEKIAKRLVEAAPKLTILSLGKENLNASEELVNGIVNGLIKERLKQESRP